MDQNFGCCILPIVAVLLVVLSSIFEGDKQQKKLEEAKKTFEETLQALREKYDAALQALRENPADPATREAALQAGREYSEFARTGEGVALFDEVALMNDINAAAAAAPVAAASTAPDQKGSSESAEQRLAKLESLKEKGLISDEEYQETRQRILSEL